MNKFKFNKIASIILVFSFSAMAIGDEKIRVVSSDSVDVLKNLGDVSVIVDVNEYAKQEGFTIEAVSLRAKQELLENGVRVVPNQKSFETASQGYFYMRVLLLGEQAVVTCGLNERVVLTRNTNIVVIGAETYGKMYGAAHESKKSNVWRMISKAITDFSIDHMKANK